MSPVKSFLAISPAILLIPEKLVVKIERRINPQRKVSQR
jgi:hypothetical protein